MADTAGATAGLHGAMGDNEAEDNPELGPAPVSRSLPRSRTNQLPDTPTFLRIHIYRHSHEYVRTPSGHAWQQGGAIIVFCGGWLHSCACPIAVSSL